MSDKHDPYFTPIENQDKNQSLQESVDSEMDDPYFTPLDDSTPIDVPDTIETEPYMTAFNGYQFIQKEIPKVKNVRNLFFAVTGFFVFMMLWQAYSIFIELMSISTIFGSVFGVLLLVLLQLIVKEGYKFRKGQLQFSKVEKLREQAEIFSKERSHGNGDGFLNELSLLYENKPQHSYLKKATEQMPDYLNDAEIMTRLSDDFLCHLDKEAKKLVTTESINTATIVAVSQVAVVDSLIVLWKTLSMVNQLNTIYGLSLTRLGQWQLFVRIIKATLVSAGSQVGISAVVHKVAPGITGTVLGSIAQGLGVGTYVARIGVEAMKQTRPIAFLENESPDINLIRDGIKQSLMNLSENQELDEKH